MKNSDQSFAPVKEWPKLMKQVRSGDTIMFDSVSRMSGNAEDGFAAYEVLSMEA